VGQRRAQQPPQRVDETVRALSSVNVQHARRSPSPGGRRPARRVAFQDAPLHLHEAPLGASDHRP
ncbi:MAG: hypothetical protein M3N47_02110, partial [Chloroflexota bacterium]|nr:hypothetical protein [Chloroflexota bacterium]